MDSFYIYCQQQRVLFFSCLFNEGWMETKTYNKDKTQLSSTGEKTEEDKQITTGKNELLLPHLWLKNTPSVSQTKLGSTADSSMRTEFRRQHWWQRERKTSKQALDWLDCVIVNSIFPPKSMVCFYLGSVQFCEVIQFKKKNLRTFLSRKPGHQVSHSFTATERL